MDALDDLAGVLRERLVRTAPDGEDAAQRIRALVDREAGMLDGPRSGRAGRGGVRQ